MFKYVIAAIALVAATSAAAEAPTTRHAVASPAAKSRHAVLENIISRVQMDALITRIVATDTPVTTAKPSLARRTVVYAASAPVAMR